jgi:hypothetical protein
MELRKRGTAGYDLVSADGVKFGQIDIVDDILYLYTFEPHSMLVMTNPSGHVSAGEDYMAGIVVEYEKEEPR